MVSTVHPIICIYILPLNCLIYWLNNIWSSQESYLIQLQDKADWFVFLGAIISYKFPQFTKGLQIFTFVLMKQNFINIVWPYTIASGHLVRQQETLLDELKNYFFRWAKRLGLLPILKKKMSQLLHRDPNPWWHSKLAEIDYSAPLHSAS
jgi:hypothetical protein